MSITENQPRTKKKKTYDKNETNIYIKKIITITKKRKDYKYKQHII